MAHLVDDAAECVTVGDVPGEASWDGSHGSPPMGATTEASYLNEFHVPVGGLGQRAEIREVRGSDVVGILGEQDERSPQNVGAVTADCRSTTVKASVPRGTGGSNPSASAGPKK